MDQRRQILVLVVVTGLFLVWLRVAPVLFPTVFPKRDAVNPQAVAGAGDSADAKAKAQLANGSPKDPETGANTGGDNPATGTKVEGTDAEGATPSGNGDKPGQTSPADGQSVEGADKKAELPKLVEHEPVVVQLGKAPTEGATGPQYLQTLGITSEGASIAWQQLSDPRYLTLDRTEQIKLLGNNTGSPIRTLQTSVPAIDVQLDRYGLSLRTVHWKLDTESSRKVAEPNIYDQVQFSYTSPDGILEVRKRLSLDAVDPKTIDEKPDGYLVQCELTFVNHGDQTTEISYDMQGPTGLPLEDVLNARVFREAEAATLERVGDNDTITPVKLSSSQVVNEIGEALGEGRPEDRPRWTYPVRWAGIDVQYFTALVIPGDPQAIDTNRDGQPNPYYSEILPTIVTPAEQVERSDISLLFRSVPLVVASRESLLSAPAVNLPETLPGEEALATPGAGETPSKDRQVVEGVTHRFALYLGPKKAALLEPLMADAVIDYSWFPLLPQSLIRGVSKMLHGLLRFFHEWLFLPYWLAIILLTVVVRACMFPLSKKQVKNMQKLKDLQPRLQELEKKYPDDRERRDREKLQLMMKHGANPLSGCLPLLLQMPIFIGLYGALSSAIDLRLQRFLWINSLSSPDAVSPLGFTVPWVGWTELNLLPIVVIVLFQIQNKLFTPPPTNDEQAMQQKMMSYMMIVMGFLFYRVPAGLCLYFIASSLWGICERKVLDLQKVKLAAAAAEAAAAGTLVVKPIEDPKNSEPAEPGFFAKLLAIADEAKRNNTSGASAVPNKKKGKPNS
ncbi:MAG: membrane protein insertase YidC [Planctomycetaceae bacterium]